MWDYDKLFTDGNIIGVKNCYKNKILPNSIDSTTSTAWLNAYKNNNLCCKDQYVDVDDVVKHEYKTDFEIQYIIRLDEHGNVVEKLFDRERDMKPEPEPMPKLETGMFVRLADKTDWKDNTVAYVDYQNNRIVAKEGWYETLSRKNEWQYLRIVEVFSKNVFCFDQCVDHRVIWRNPEYQFYLDSKSN